MTAPVARVFHPARFPLQVAARLLFLAAVPALLLAPEALAQRRDRTGQEVVDAVCAACHGTGKDGAPKIGDRAAWRKRAEQGLSALTEHAINGIRKMPAHGGNPGTSDLEIERAIVHMVNKSGGRWIEPVGGATPAIARSSEQIVKGQCSKCHQDGANGAPKIGDRAAWLPRLKKGLDTLVASAIHGHGPMPAKGGLPDLSDQEIRGAVIYMFNYGVAVAPPQALRRTRADPHNKTVDGLEVHLGIIAAESIRPPKAGSPPVSPIAGEIPSGKGYYFLNISLADAKTRAPITHAEVDLRVADPVSSESKTLELVGAGTSLSFGNFFRMAGRNPYTITARIQRPGTPAPIEVRFDFRAP